METKCLQTTQGTSANRCDRVWEVNHYQTSKAQLPIVVTESGIVTAIKLLHLQKAYFSMDVTDCGILSTNPKGKNGFRQKRDQGR
mmetsp:Transcript_18896/g.32356  ORF Transcript_18896/g.32356 Transcript_18896/m.32356 type:complete len:85 (-) Transcript_18896:814-1068(-)